MSVSLTSCIFVNKAFRGGLSDPFLRRVQDVSYANSLQDWLRALPAIANQFINNVYLTPSKTGVKASG
ncbi:hypothetical protein QUA81_33405 [Microcoleus sp. F6_B4]